MICGANHDGLEALILKPCGFAKQIHNGLEVYF